MVGSELLADSEDGLPPSGVAGADLLAGEIHSEVEWQAKPKVVSGPRSTLFSRTELK